MQKSYLWFPLLLCLFFIVSCTHDECKKDCQPYHKQPPSPNVIIQPTPSSNQCKITFTATGSVEPQALGAGVIYMVAGVYLSIAGFMFFRPTVFIIGCFIGSFISWLLLQRFEPKEGYPNCHNLYLSVGLASGITVGGFLLLFYQYAIPLLGLSVGVLLYTFVLSWKDDFLIHNLYVRLVVLGVLMAFFFFLVLFCEFITVIFSLSLLGGYGFFLGLDMMVKKGFYSGFQELWYFNQKSKLNMAKRSMSGGYHVGWEVLVFQCSLLTWVIVTMIWQCWLNKGTRFGVRIIRNTNDTLEKIK